MDIKNRSYEDKKIEKKNDSSKKELLEKIKTVKIDKENGLVFFGTCHCSGNTVSKD
ncbi:hypothetical protein [Anaerococcus sp. AGMB09787]|uniref:hypothetical protein n=1 Tax=Anaerococcus sp. AGMB09787 TaxID=2922869 RepID=UPI001FAEDC7C|nr:hypothetical protein [Anaerococcus sp. AGMB09787]